MNLKTRVKLLKLRSRADLRELENLDLRERLVELQDKIAELARERGAAEVDMIRRHQAELAKAREGSGEVQQKIAHLESMFERALEALEHVAPLWRDHPARWRETILRQDLWYSWRGAALGIELRRDRKERLSLRTDDERRNTS